MKQVFTETKCPVCNNDFAYQPEDVITKDNKSFVICPICGKECEIE